MRNLQHLSFLRSLAPNNSNIGVLGGSFDPAHLGHLQISLRALKKFKLDFVIWLIANQNPFKPKYKNSMTKRAIVAEEIADHPRIIVTTLEQDLGTFYSYDTMMELRRKFTHLNFTWLMGVDNISHFPDWYRADQLAKLVDIIIFDRPTTGRFTNHCCFLSKFERTIANSSHPHIIVDRGALCPVSSTAIKNI